MMPLWMKLLSGFYVDPAVVVIPYFDIFKALLLVTIPSIAGIILKRIFPRIARFFTRISKYLSFAFIAFQVSQQANVQSILSRTAAI